MEARLQIVCLIFILYFEAMYIKKTTGENKIKCNRLFDGILIVTPWAVFFDGLTAITVNHMDVVSRNVNLVLHGFFLFFMNVIILISFRYMLHITVGHISKLKKYLYLSPGIVAIVMTIVFLPRLEFIKGKYTYYSMGTSVYFSFASFLLYYSAMLVVLIAHRKSVERQRLVSMFFIIATAFAALILQAIMPEILFTSVPPTLLLLGFYINLEDPYLKQVQTYNENMVADFATLVENRDNNTGGHIIRTQAYVSIILDIIKNNPKYRNVMSRDYLKNVKNAAPMHDIGKITTPDYILQKPGKLTDDEYAIMKQHSVKGGEIIEKSFSDLNNPEFEKIAFEVARYHHEKWNGKGYPDGLKEEEIPLHARIMAIADVFDAVSAKRCYRDALPIETCFKIIEDGVGTDFDPFLAHIFLDNKDAVLEVYNGMKNE